jgi:tetratricopeptide (TPR) repeat protein
MLVVESLYRVSVVVRARRSGPPSSFVLYGLGESTMTGEPFGPKVSLPNLVSVMLGARVGGRPVEVVVLARRGAPLHRQLNELQREVAFRDRSAPGAVLIYSGHNEGRLAPGSVQSWSGRLEFSPLLDASWILRDGFEALRQAGFVRVPHGIEDYDRLLRKTLEVARRAGLVPILYTPPSNLAGIEPNCSPSPGIASFLEEGTRLEGAGRHAEALAHYRRGRGGMAHAGSEAATLILYRIARCEVALGRFDEARDDLWRVVADDPRSAFGRATPAQIADMRLLAGRDHAPLVDGVALFEGASPHGIPGNELFADGHHPNLDGYAILARGAADVLVRTAHATTIRPLADGRDVAAAVGLTGDEQRSAHLRATMWLVGASIGHPWAIDRMTLASEHFRAALALRDDFTARFGLALAESGRDGAPTTADAYHTFCRVSEDSPIELRVDESAWPAWRARFHAHHVDSDLLARLELLWSRGQGRPSADEQPSTK